MHGHATNFIEDLTKLSMQLMQVIRRVNIGMEWFFGKDFFFFIDMSWFLTLKLLVTSRRKRQETEKPLERKLDHSLVKESSKEIYYRFP